PVIKVNHRTPLRRQRNSILLISSISSKLILILALPVSKLLPCRETKPWRARQLFSFSEFCSRLTAFDGLVCRFDVARKPFLARPLSVLWHFDFLLDLIQRFAFFHQLADAFQEQGVVFFR